MSSGCGCKEIYRFPHITYTYILLLYVLFLQQHPNFLFFKKNVFVLIPVHFCNILTLGAHARSEGYCSCPVGVCVCVCS